MHTQSSADRIDESSGAPSIATSAAVAAAIASSTASVHAEDVDRDARLPIETLDALREARLLSAFVPTRLGGGGASLAEITRICSTLAGACAASGMIYAMHCIQVASIVRHAAGRPELEDYLRRLVREQRLIASVTSEVGTGGDLRSSVCHVEPVAGGRFRLEKSTTTSSYCEYADDLLLTARRAQDAVAGDQVLVLLGKDDFVLHDVGTWDTLGMRGTCSPPARVVGEGEAWQILHEPFRDIAASTMVPVSHITWAAVWLGIAGDAYERARRFLRMRARKDPEGSVLAANRLGEIASQVSGMRARLAEAVSSFEARSADDVTGASGPGALFAINELKLAVSEGLVEVVDAAIRVIGIAAYRNDGDFSLGRHLRDGHSAALMIHNDRIRSTNADLLVVYKGR